MTIVLGVLAGAVLVLTIVAGFAVRSQLMRNPYVAGDTHTPLRGWLFAFAVPYRLPLGVGFLLTLVSTLLSMAAPWPFKVMVDHAVGDEPLPAWLSAAEGLTRQELAIASVAAGLGLVIAGVFVGYLTTYLIGTAEIRMAADIRASVFRRMQEVSLRFHDANRTGDLVSRLMSDVGRVRDVMLTWLNQVFPEVLTLVGVLVVMLLMSPTMTLLALSVIPVLIWYAHVKRPRLKKVSRRARDRRGELASHATDALRNVRVVQAFSRETLETGRFRTQLNRTADAQIDSMDVSARYAPISTIVVTFGSSLVSVYGVLQILDGKMSLGTLLVFLSYLASLYGPVRSLSRLVSTLAKGQASRDRLMEVYDDEFTVVDTPNASDAWKQPASLSMENVCFAYDESAPVLRDFTMELRAGEAVCIVGASGEGKSTLLSLLLRLYEPTSGAVRLGRSELKDLRLSSLRERIALVPQDPWMMDGSIYDNVVFGQADAGEAAFTAAVDEALVSDFAENLPESFDTRVGEGGGLLSGGQRRRIALARALIRKASILLLDEPTSGLDAASADGVMKAIDRARVDRTTIVVTHDLAVAERINNVMVIEEGTVVQRGTHYELVDQSGPYRTLWLTQKGLAVVPDLIILEDHVDNVDNVDQATGAEQVRSGTLSSGVHGAAGLE